MPSKNALKIYVAGDYYHAYNRGVEKRKVFLDHADYTYFLYLLKRHLDPNYQPIGRERQPRNLSKEVELNAFCLMPNHIHLLLHQLTERGLEQFSRSVFTSYSLYFNKRYNRVGSLFQDTYKAVHIERDNQLTHNVNYIHANPLDIGNDPSRYSYSSYAAYFDHGATAWLKPMQGDFLPGDSLRDAFEKSRLVL